MTTNMEHDTNAALVRIEDTRFELLAAAYVRRVDPARYGCLIHFGLNDEGKPVPSKVDGFCLVPGTNPPHYVQLAATTTQLDGLQSKWFSRGKKLGDLPKAFNEAKKIRKKQPNSTFSLFLATNRCLDTELSTKVSTAGTAWFEIIPVEQTALVDFLDNTADGQYFRQTLIGLPARRLSLELLEAVGIESLEAHRRCFHVPDRTAAVTREGISGTPFHGWIIPLVGHSGTGKSTACHQLAELAVEHGDLAIWIPAEYLEESPPNEAMRLVIQQHQPGFPDDEARRAVEVARRAGRRIVAIIDDPNRLQNPPQLLKRLVDWKESAAPQANEGDRTLIFVIPVWPTFAEGLEKLARDHTRIAAVQLREYTVGEARQVLRVSSPRDQSDTSLDELAFSLGYDPYLIGLYQQAQIHHPVPLPVNPWNLQEQVLRDSIDDSRQRSPNPPHERDFERALQAVASAIVRERSLTPARLGVRQQLQLGNGREVEAFDLLVRDGNLISVDASEAICFRHDRFRDFLLARYLVAELLAVNADLGAVSWRNHSSELLLSGGFALALGELQVAVCQHLVELLAVANPLALAQALRTCPHLDRSLQSSIGNALHTFLIAEPDLDHPRALQEAVKLELMQVMSPSVQTAVQGVKGLPARVAAFQNGDLNAGLRCLAAWKDTWRPGLRSAWWDKAVASHLQVQGQTAFRELSALLAQTRDQVEVRSLLDMAGFFGHPALASSITVAWERHRSTRLLLHVLWAAIRCYRPGQADFLDELLRAWADAAVKWDDYPDDFAPSWIATQLGWAGHRGFPDEAVAQIVNAARGAHNFGWPFSGLVAHLDHPLAAIEVAKFKANYPSSPGDPITFGESSNIDCYGPRTRAALLKEWREGQPGLYRQWLFDLWRKGTTRDDMALLRVISESDELYRLALKERARLRDPMAADALVERVKVDQTWLPAAAFVWSSRLEYQVGRFIEALPVPQANVSEENDPRKSNIVWFIGHALMEAPTDAVERLLVPRLEPCRNYPLIIEAAILRATPALTQWVHQAISRNDAPSWPFERLLPMYLLTGRAKPELQALKALAPYISLIPEADHHIFATKLLEFGYEDWVEQYLQPLLTDENRRLVSPTETELLEQLEFVASGNHHADPDAYARYEVSRLRSARRVMAILPRWLEKGRTNERLELAAELIANHGTRDDLSLLDPVKSVDQNRARYLQKNTLCRICHRTLYPRSES